MPDLVKTNKLLLSTQCWPIQYVRRFCEFINKSGVHCWETARFQNTNKANNLPEFVCALHHKLIIDTVNTDFERRLKNGAP